MATYPALTDQQRETRMNAIADARRKGLTLKQIGEQFGISTDRVRQIIVERARRLRLKEGLDIEYFQIDPGVDPRRWKRKKARSGLKGGEIDAKGNQKGLD